MNALSATAGLVDLGVYIHADEAVIERWYIERFHRLCAEATPGSFYAQFAGLDATQIDAVAQHVWDTINLVNLRDYIEPSRVLRRRHRGEAARPPRWRRRRRCESMRPERPGPQGQERKR